MLENILYVLGDNFKALVVPTSGRLRLSQGGQIGPAVVDSLSLEATSVRLYWFLNAIK